MHILRPTTLHEVTKQEIIAEQELFGNKVGDKTPNLSFHGKTPRRGGQYLRHKSGGSHHQRFQKNHTFKNHRNNPRKNLQQNNAYTQESPNKRVKFMKTAPTNGCWTRGGPHYERDCPERKIEAQSE